MRASWYGLPGLTVALTIAASTGTAIAWNNEAHRAMTSRAVDESTLGTYLAEELRFTRGLNEELVRSGSTILSARNWVREGSVREDEPVLRVQNHFHNPTLSLPFAGLNVPPFLGESAVLFAQNRRQNDNNGGGNHSWKDARDSLLTALTATTSKDRQTAFSNLFETLGHQVHLIQDTANPAHTRNDAHPALPLDRRNKHVVGDPDRFHFWAEDSDNLAGAFRDPAGNALPSLQPEPSVLAQELGANPLLPIARLIDTGQYIIRYADKATPPPAGLDLGMAEYSNAHFFSDDTILKDFDFPSLATTQLDNGTIDPRSGRFRWYLLSKTLTPAPGVSLATISALNNELPDTEKSKSKFKLNQKVFTDTSRMLFPRAVGFSTALLNYFFRGKLDVNVEFPAIEQDENGQPLERDPEIRQLVGVNASEETLGPGKILVYAEDLKTGDRQQVLDPASQTAPLGEVDILPAAPGGPIVNATGQPIRFRVKTASERYVVVFKGTLGAEEPDPGFVGAVVGKVIGGETPEGIVIKDGRRVFRSPEVTLDLPALADGIARVQWGDLDNTFVGVVAADPDSAPEQVRAFRIPREAGSTTVPATAQPDGGSVLTLETLKSVRFPFGVPLGTTVDWTAGGTFVEALIVTEIKTDYAWGPDPDTGEDAYVLHAQTAEPPALQRPVSAGVAFNESFPIVLDAAHYAAGGSLPRPYAWRVAEVGFDAQQRLLAIVDVQLTRPTNALSHVPLQALDAECALAPRSPLALSASFPITTLLSAVIDVETGQVLGTTASNTVTLHTSADSYFQIVQQKVTTTRAGGPDPGTRFDCLDRDFMSENPDYQTQERAALTLPSSGPTRQTIEGWYRSDLDGLVSTSQDIASDTGSGLFVYWLDGETRTAWAVRLHAPTTRLTGYLTHIREGVRIRPATTSTPQVLLRFGRPVGVQASEGEEAVLVQWSPVSPGETRLAIPGELEPATYTLIKATPRAALLRVEDAGGATSFLVDLERRSVQDLRVDVTGDFALLAPELLYNVNDTRFYTLDLEQTALPLPLEQGPTGPQPIADFHVITVP